MRRQTGASDRESVRGELIHETDKAFLFDPDTSQTVWLPKSQCTWVPDSEESDQTQGSGGYMLIPDWLMREKGLD